jgi:hypothetical protein
MVAVIRRGLAAALALAPAIGALAGCLSIPAYDPLDLVSYKADGTGANVTGPDFALHFAGGNSFHFPDGLMAGASGNLLGHDPGSACYDESGTGFAIFPTPRVSWDGDAPPVHNQLAAVMHGPAIVQVRIDWTTELTPMCTHDHAPGGTSTFTVFPDGHIVRHDTLVDPGSDSISPIACACQSTNRPEFDVSSYWTFAPSFQALYGLSAGGEMQAVTVGPGTTANFATVCLDGTTYQVVSTWAIPPDSSASGFPANMFGGNALIGHRLQKPIGLQNLVVAWDIHGALFLDHRGCSMAVQRATDFAAAAPLIVNGAPAAMSPLDGIYGGDPGAGAAPGIAAVGQTEITGQARPGFAVWLRFSGAADGVRATLAGATGSWYVPQRIDDSNWIVWFRDALATGQTISIESL